jgi:hypothetical protein
LAAGHAARRRHPRNKRSAPASAAFIHHVRERGFELSDRRNREAVHFTDSLTVGPPLDQQIAAPL